MRGECPAVTEFSIIRPYVRHRTEPPARRIDNALHAGQFVAGTRVSAMRIEEQGAATCRSEHYFWLYWSWHCWGSFQPGPIAGDGVYGPSRVTGLLLVVLIIMLVTGRI